MNAMADLFADAAGEPRVLNVKDLELYAPRRVIFPPGAVYIGRFNRTYGLAGSDWANAPLPNSSMAARIASITAYERWLLGNPKMMARLHELRGRCLVCWCAPKKPCHGDVLLRLANT
jgi:Domain of unknown function (DUF4326)